MSKIIDLEVLGNFKERQDAVNEDKFLKRSNVTANGNEVKIVTTEADSDQGISEVSYTALTPNSSLNASKITGVIDISHIPASAQERVVTVANATARKALTTNDVQKGDVVKETDTGLMYFVVDDTKLNQDAGYTAFAAGIASSADTVKLTPTRADANYALVYADATTITSATTKGLAVASHSSTAANCPIRVNPGVNNSTSQGYATLFLGNNINNGTAYNKQGRIVLYGTNTGYTTIVPGYASTSNITLTLPSATGTIALTSSDITGSSASCTGNAATATTASACSGNSASATYATNVRITPSDGTTAYPVTMLNGSTASTDYALRTAVNNTTVANSGLKCIPGADVAANTEGTTTLVIGNALAKATADNRTGNIRIHGNNTGYTTIKPGYNSTSNITLTLPSATGTIALTSSDITGNAATATSAAACTGNSATATTASACSGNAATATKLATARNIGISDSDGTNTGTAASFNGTAAVTIKLPATIKASITGNCSGSSGSCTGNAATATTSTNSNNVKSTISTGTYYSVLGVAGGTATNAQATPQRGNATNISFRDGANAVTAYSDFLVGNSTAATSSASAARTGRLFLYGTGAYYVAFTPGANTANATVTTTISHNLTVKSAAAVTLTLPSSTGTLALKSDIPTAGHTWCTTNATTTSTASSTNPAVVTTNYVSGRSWYRIWSDGWVEQGGYVSQTTNAEVTITLQKEMKSTDYAVLITTEGGEWGDTALGSRNYMVMLVNTQSFKLFIPGTYAIKGKYWRVCGYKK